MSNPFKYGTVVSGKDFADRQQELKELADRLKEPVRIFLVAPRRYGKTSLIQNVLNTLRKEWIEQATQKGLYDPKTREGMEFKTSYN